MSSENIVENILTSILQWRVDWLDEQKALSKPPPICRAEPRKLKITYDSYKDYETTFVPLLMHEIWAQIFEEWTKIENELSGNEPMDIDDGVEQPKTSSNNAKLPNSHARSGRFQGKSRSSDGFGNCHRQFWIGIADYRAEGQFQCNLRCQAVIEPSQVSSHLRLIGEGDLVRLDLIVESDPKPKQQNGESSKRANNSLSLFGYVVDVSSERIGPYTTLADCFSNLSNKRNFQLINYQVVIAKRPLRLKQNEAMKISCLYYLKPMIRQIESVTTLTNSALAGDILSPKHFTCQLTVPTILTVKSPYYNDMQYKAIIGANEAMVRNVPKIQLIQGPPGTGKTHTLVGIIKHFYTKWTDVDRMPKLLICAPSNGAIDEVVKRLYSEREFLKKGPAARSLRLVRVGHPDHILPGAKQCSLEDLVETNTNYSVQIIQKKQESRIKEIEAELSSCDTEITNLRYSNREKEVPEIEKKIVQLLKEMETIKSNEGLKAKREVSEASKKNLRYAIIKNADVILTTLNSCQRRPLDVLFKTERGELSFHCVIVDEASQCCEPELLMPLCYRISRMILIGDPMQLPATVISRYAQEFDFGRSLFERFFIHFGEYSSSSPIAMLTEQYRMHPEICHFPSKQFYDGRLVCARTVFKQHSLKPYIIFDLRNSKESKSGTSASVENQAEADLVRNLLFAVSSRAPDGSKIGVITPYKGQKRLITNKICNLQPQRDITIDVNTCDGFQGQEKDIIILSCVRSFENHGTIGFLKSIQRMNVALTRAKDSMIICISAKSLSKDETWNNLIEDAIERKVLNTLTHVPSAGALIEMLNNTNPGDSFTFQKTEDGEFVPGSSLLKPNLDQNESNAPEYVIPMDID